MRFEPTGRLVRPDESIDREMLAATVFFLLWSISWEMCLDAIYERTLGSCVLVSLTSLASSKTFVGLVADVLRTVRTAREVAIPLFVSWAIAFISLFLLLRFLRYPTKRYTPKKEIILKELQIFLLSFVSLNVILAMMRPDFGASTLYSLVSSLAISFLRIFISFSWRKVVTKPRQYPMCRMDLSDLPQDVSICPYCGRKLEMNKLDEAI